jgi:hypothetical protein
MNYARFAAACSLVALAACSGNSVKDTLGISRKPPDEFRVVSRPPLSVPPQFNLRPPSATDEAPGVAPADKQAQSIITGTAPDTQTNTFILSPNGDATAPTTLKSGAKPESPESEFLKKAGADKADPNVRNALVEEHITTQEKQEDSSWWNVMSTTPDKKESLVDAKKETQRIEKNEEEGKPVTEGETPEVKGRDTGVLGRILGY